MIIFAWFVRQSDLELDHVVAPDLHFGDVISAIARETDILWTLHAVWSKFDAHVGRVHRWLSLYW